MLAITTTLLRGPHEGVGVYRRAAERGVRFDSRSRANRAIILAAAGELREAVNDFRVACPGLADDAFEKTFRAALVMAGEYVEARTLCVPREANATNATVNFLLMDDPPRK